MFKRNRHHSRCCRGRNQNIGPSQMMPSQVMPSQIMPSQMMPSQVMPSQFETPQFSPQEQFVQTNVMHTVVPHVHPAHITTVNKHVIDHQHHFPVTESVVNECCENHTICGNPHHHRRGQQPRY